MGLSPQEDVTAASAAPTKGGGESLEMLEMLTASKISTHFFYEARIKSISMSAGKRRHFSEKKTLFKSSLS